MIGPSRHSGRPGRSGFSLVELLLVVTIITAMMSMMLPALARARGLARGIQCRSNLGQMQTAWLMFIEANGQRIPYTYSSSRRPNWVDGMASILGEGGVDLYGTNAVSVAACPEVQRSYFRMFYVQPHYGYAINTWWDDATGAYNEQQSWNRILSPSSYPWFIDPQVYKWGSGFMASHRVPYPARGAPDWGIGANHDGGNITNASFADGSTRSVPIEEVRNDIVGFGSYRWLAND